MKHALTLALVLATTGCGGGRSPTPGLDAAPPTPDASAVCAAGGDKIKFARETACANDGSVEWCVPDGDTGVLATLTAISPSITCAAGGGRAGCQTGQLLCLYPTTVPDQCLSLHGEMTADAWADLCAIAALPQVVAIVPTIFE